MRNYDASATVPPQSGQAPGAAGPHRSSTRSPTPHAHTIPAQEGNRRCRRPIAASTTASLPQKPRAAARRRENPIRTSPHAKKTGVRRRMPRMETPTANFTHHFPDRHAQHGRSALRAHAHLHRRTQRPGRARHHRNRPIDMTWPASSSASRSPLEAEAAAQPVYFGGRCRPTAASCCTARSATGTPRSRSPTRSAHQQPRRAAGHRRRGRTQGRHRHPRLRRLGRRPARAGILDNAWLTVPADLGIVFERRRGAPRRRHAEARHRLHQPRAMSPDMPEAATAAPSPGHRFPGRPDTLPARGTVLGFDFGLARIGVASGSRDRPQRAHHRSAEANDARFAAIARLIAEWRPVALVVGIPTHLDGREHELTARAAASPTSSTAATPCRCSLSTSACPRSPPKPGSAEAGRKDWRERKRCSTPPPPASSCKPSWTHDAMKDLDAEALCRQLAEQIRPTSAPPPRSSASTPAAWLAERLHAELASPSRWARSTSPSTATTTPARACTPARRRPDPFDVDAHVIPGRRRAHTGRTTRAALNELFDFAARPGRARRAGRPRRARTAGRRALLRPHPVRAAPREQNLELARRFPASSSS